MSKKSQTREGKEVGIPAEILQELVSHITLEDMEFGDAEEALELVKAKLGELAMAKVIAELPEEDRRPKACPKCRSKVPVKGLAKPRKIVSMSGSQILKRNYHYCENCKEGFYPRDLKLGLSKRGEFSPEMEKRILDTH